MRLLLDTNILIPLEPTSLDDVEPNTKACAELYRLCNESGNQLLIHPAIEHDLTKDRNSKRTKLRRTLFDKYTTLTAPPLPTTLDPMIVGEPAPGTNDYVDNCLLAAVKGNAVHFLVTEDKEIHSKAKRLDVTESVLNLRDAIFMLKALFDEHVEPPPLVEDVSAHQLDLKDPIFVSLRADYTGFDRWFEVRCMRENRRTFLVRNPLDHALAGLVIIKREDGVPGGPSGKTLKLCTFKVSETSGGQRYGELLLKTTFEYLRKNNFDFSYCTVLPKHQGLMDFLCSFGFVIQPHNEKGESVLMKALRFGHEDMEKMDPLEFHIRYGSLVASWKGSGFVVPILPQFHRVLFPESEQQQTLFQETMPCGNSIKKAYLCHSRMTTLRKGDILFFYRSQDVSGLTTFGVVEEWIRSHDPNMIAKYVGTRTVYRFLEIQKLSKKPVLVIKFRLVDRLATPILLQNLINHRVLHGQPQSIVRIGRTGLEWLRKEIEKQ